MPAPSVTLITELQVCIRRDFPLTVPGILNPLDAAPLTEGEWLELDSSYLLKRGASNSVSPAVFMTHTERGRYDTQSIGKANVIFAGQYEAETLVHLADLSGYAIGDALTVGDVVMGAVTRRGLVKAGTPGQPVVGFITKITGTGTTAQLRFLHTGIYKY
jgi:hypothetical protein